jgi:hypothetical protein
MGRRRGLRRAFGGARDALNMSAAVAAGVCVMGVCAGGFAIFGCAVRPASAITSPVMR